MARIGQRTFLVFVCLLFSVALACMVPVVSGPSKAYADPTSADKQAEAQAVLASLNSMQEKLDKASNDYYAALEEQEAAETNRDAAQARIDEVSAEIADSQDRLSKRARDMYRSGSTTFLDILLGSTSFQAFATNWDMLNQINQSDSELIQQTKDLRAEEEEQKAVYEEQARVAEEKAAEAKSIEEEAQATVASMQETYDSLSAEAAELLEQERAAQAAAEAAAAQAELEEQAAAATTNNGGGSTGGNTGGTGGGTGGTTNTNNSYAGVADAGSVTGRAYSYIGNAAYVWGACSPGAFDCSGFVSYCLTGQYARLGTTYTFLGWTRVTDPQPGDVCVNENHCGIYVGGGQMVHCATYGVGVIQGPVQSGMVYVRY